MFHPRGNLSNHADTLARRLPRRQARECTLPSEIFERFSPEIYRCDDVKPLSRRKRISCHLWLPRRAEGRQTQTRWRGRDVVKSHR